MRIEFCDCCKKDRAIGRMKIQLRRIGSSLMVFSRNIPKTAYCKSCAEKTLKKIVGKITKSTKGDVKISKEKIK